MSQLQIRIDDKTKQSAKKVFDKLGIDMTTGIKLYLNQIVIHQSIPFRLVTENGLTPEEEKEILQAKEDAKNNKNISKAMNLKESINYLKSI